MKNEMKKKMKTNFFVLLAIILCANAADVKKKKDAAEPAQNKDKRQTQGEGISILYRGLIKQDQVAPVEEPQDDDGVTVSRSATDEYRPGQVYSLNTQELLELQPERKAPVASSQQLQQLYSEPQAEHKQGLQPFYYAEPQTARQVALQPSHAVISRPLFSANGGEASVGAALSVSDSGTNQAVSFDQELLALLSNPAVRKEERQPAYAQQVSQSVSPQYQQVDRYITKPSKKPTKLRSKVQIAPPQAPAAPQQYLIETTNVQQQQPQPQPQQQQLQYRIATLPQAQRPVQAHRYNPVQPTTAAAQQIYYERPEPQGLKVVPAPKLHQPRAQINYRFVPQYQQPEAAPKQYRIVEAPRPQPARHEPQRVSSPSIERPVTFLKRYQEPEKQRAVKFYEQASEEIRAVQQPAPVAGEQYYIRPLYRGNEQRPRYELQSFGLEQARVADPTKPPHSAIYVSKNVGLKKPLRQQPIVEQPAKVETQYRQEVQQYRLEQPSRVEQVNIEQHGQNLEAQRSHLPPPRNNKAYTPEEFQALVAAGYAVTPIPVGSLGQQSQSRSAIEPAPAPAQRRVLQSRRHQYLPLRADEAP